MKKFFIGVMAGIFLTLLLQRSKAIQFTQAEIDHYYKQRARYYPASDHDFAFGGYKPRLELRKRAVQQLGLKAGDKVLDIACGTGANFPEILKAIGPTGEIIGVDYNPAMLLEAQRHIEENQWDNIFLIQQDAAQLETGEHYDAVICVLGMSVIPNYENAMRHAFAHVRQGGTLVIADISTSELWYLQPFHWLAEFFFIQDTTRRPWELLEAWADDFEREELLLGYMYVASGRKGRN